MRTWDDHAEIRQSCALGVWACYFLPILNECRQKCKCSSDTHKIQEKKRCALDATLIFYAMKATLRCINVKIDRIFPCLMGQKNLSSVHWDRKSHDVPFKLCLIIPKSTYRIALSVYWSEIYFPGCDQIWSMRFSGGYFLSNSPRLYIRVKYIIKSLRTTYCPWQSLGLIILIGQCPVERQLGESSPNWV